MPLKPKHPCTHPGCQALVDDGARCSQHLRQAQQELDARRGSSTARGYDGRWRKARDIWLQNHPFCGDRQDGPSAEHSKCRAEHRIAAGEIIDHIVPHRGDHDLFWNPRNWQTLCTTCHDRKTATEDGGFGNRQSVASTDGANKQAKSG